MHLLRVHGRARILVGAGLIGLFGLNIGCDGGSGGESTATPSTPPAGQSGADQGSARKNSYPTSAAAAKKIGDQSKAK
jgi:hypothetical protein